MTRNVSRKKLPVMPPDVDGDALPRPALYEECRGGHRPCPIVSCPNNNYLEIIGRRVKLPHGDLEPWEIPPELSCAGDMTEGARSETLVSRLAKRGLAVDGRAEAKLGDMTLEEIGDAFNVSRERIRQIERAALVKMMHRMLAAGWTREDVIEYLASIKGEGEGNTP